jgi:CHAD domain-containing protein
MSHPTATSTSTSDRTAAALQSSLPVAAGAPGFAPPRSPADVADRFRARMTGWLSDLERTAARAVRLEQDPEVYHQLRVLVRRLRAGLRLMREVSPDRKRTATLVAIDSELRGLAAAAGPIRDADVLARHLDGDGTDDPEAGPKSALAAFGRLPDTEGSTIAGGPESGLARSASDAASGPALAAARDLLRCDLAARRSAALPRLVRTIEAIRRAGVTGRTAASLDGLVLSPASAPAFAGLLHARLVRIVDSVGRAERTGDPEAFHSARIQVKRLRYGLELALDAKSGLPVIDGLARLQQLLGSAHDHQVWSERCRTLRRHLTRRGHDVLPRRGLADLLCWEASAARACQRRSVQHWDALVEGGYTEQVIGSLSHLAAADPAAIEAREAR